MTYFGDIPQPGPLTWSYATRSLLLIALGIVAVLLGSKIQSVTLSTPPFGRLLVCRVNFCTFEHLASSPKGWLQNFHLLPARNPRTESSWASRSTGMCLIPSRRMRDWAFRTHTIGLHAPQACGQSHLGPCLIELTSSCHSSTPRTRTRPIVQWKYLCVRTSVCTHAHAKAPGQH